MERPSLTAGGRDSKKTPEKAVAAWCSSVECLAVCRGVEGWSKIWQQVAMGLLGFAQGWTRKKQDGGRKGFSRSGGKETG